MTEHEPAGRLAYRGTGPRTGLALRLDSHPLGKCSSNRPVWDMPFGHGQRLTNFAALRLVSAGIPRSDKHRECQDRGPI